MVDDSDDASGAGYSQQRVACVGVIGPGTRVKVFIRLYKKLVKKVTQEDIPTGINETDESFCLKA